jgi:hypothetical protein
LLIKKEIIKLLVLSVLRKRNANSFIEFKNKLFLLEGPLTFLPNKNYWILDLKAYKL